MVVGRRRKTIHGWTNLVRAKEKTIHGRPGSVRAKKKKKKKTSKPGSGQNAKIGFSHITGIPVSYSRIYNTFFLQAAGPGWN